jgi:hypothetical protein
MTDHLHPPLAINVRGGTYYLVSNGLGNRAAFSLREQYNEHADWDGRRAIVRSFNAPLHVYPEGRVYYVYAPQELRERMASG